MIKHISFKLLILLALIGFGESTAQVTVTATSDSGSGYSTFTAAGFGIEGPDESSPTCFATPATDAGNHKDFGAHILQVADAELGQNVFAFVSHIDDDSDRCLVQDRVRMEVKGGPNGASDPQLEHNFGDTSFYRWQFKLDDNFVGSSSFCHLFQNKAQGGGNSDQPILTLTARTSQMELVYSPIDDGSSSVDLLQHPLADFRGKWVEVYMRQVHSDNGLLEVNVNDVTTGAPIFTYLNEDIDLWRETDSPAFINRPKWGVYRRKATGLRDETVLFGNICSAESVLDVCPSLLPTAGGAPSAVIGAVPIDGAAHVPLSMPLAWQPSAGATGYNVYFGEDTSPPLVVSGTAQDTMYAATLEYGKTYYYQIGAVNAEGETRTGVFSFATLATADTQGWEVVRGHAAPSVEASNYYEFNTNIAGAPGTNQTNPVVGEAGNAAYAWFSGPSEGSNSNYRWRYRQDAGESTTVVLRIAPSAGVNNLGFVEFYGLGWRQKVRLNRSDARFERTVDDPQFEWPADFWEDGKFRILRFTFEPTSDGNMLTSLYLDESSTAFATGLSDETRTSNYIDIGRNGGTNYGSEIDYIAINPTGAFAPDSLNAPELPTDLFGGGGGVNGTPAAVTNLLPLDGVVDVPLTMPLAWDADPAATRYNIYFGTNATPPLVADTTATLYPFVLAAGTTYFMQIGSVNDNGETLGAVQRFTTLANPDDGTWFVARGHAKPHIENGDDFEFDTNLTMAPDLDSVFTIAGSNNAAFAYLSGPKEGSNGNYRWRYRQEESDEVTLVVRTAAIPSNNNLFYVEHYGMGWRHKIRINQATAKFEKTADEPEFAFPTDFWDQDTFHVFRFTFEATSDGNVLAKMYVDGDPSPFGEGTSNEDKDGGFIDVGRAGGENYGAYFDYIAVNPTGAYALGDQTAPALPSDLISPDVLVSTVNPHSFKQVTLSPNPVRERLVLRGVDTADARYRIVSATGQVVQVGQTMSNNEVAVAALPPGTYTLQVFTQKGEVVVGRFVKL